MYRLTNNTGEHDRNLKLIAVVKLIIQQINLHQILTLGQKLTQKLIDLNKQNKKKKNNIRNPQLNPMSLLLMTVVPQLQIKNLNNRPTNKGDYSYITITHVPVSMP